MPLSFTRRSLSALMPATWAAAPFVNAKEKETPRDISLNISDAKTPIDRFFDLSVGADFPGTLIRDENLKQLKISVEEHGFRYIRFHDIFHDALGTVSVKDKKVVCDWTKIDYLYDQLLAMKIKPFIELGFTPKALKTSDKTIFFWKGNVSHPRFDLWKQLIDQFVRHLISRYGKEEVRTWFFEVWNEPNLEDFFQYADREVYFALYGLTARTIKAIDPALKVGGPATAGLAWITEFLDFAKKTNAPVDFVATHHYGVSSGFLDEFGKQDTKLDPSPDAIIGGVKHVRNLIEKSPFPGLPLYFTEWSTSYSSRDLVHDSYISGPYILSKLKALQGVVQGMSYWVYSDLFEEAGPPPTPFHGGFGLMTREGIRKAKWFAYKYLAALKGLEIPTGDASSWASTDAGNISAVVWDFSQPKQETSNRTFFGKLVPNAPSKPARLSFKGLKKGTYRLKLNRTGYRVNDTYSAYIDMGKPEKFTDTQIKMMHALSADKPELTKTVKIDAKGHFSLDVPLKTNDMVLVSLEMLK